jgi:hypothetical protein
VKIYAVVNDEDYYARRYEAYYSSEDLAHAHMEKFHPKRKRFQFGSTDPRDYVTYYIDEIYVEDELPEEL